jgi:GT2 family glycosyltransferase
MNLGLVIASYRRPDILQKVLINLMSQVRVPDEIVLSAVDEADVPAIDNARVRTIFGTIGIPCQRNRGISCLIGTADVIIFIDDDFIVGSDYFSNVEQVFEEDNSIIGLNGVVIADGATSPGFTFERGRTLAEKYSKRPKPESYIRDIAGVYGCNMAFRTSAIGSVRFDERLALYGWQEDADFCGALRGTGRIIQTNRAWGIHLGTKLGKGSELRLGYSQIINPVYIARKGNMLFTFAFRLAGRNFLANLIKSIRPESYVDRRARLRGNLIGLLHLITGRLTPEYILQLN